MLSAPLANSFHIPPPLAGATGRFSDSENTIDLTNRLNTHKSAIAIFVDMLTSNISFNLDALSQRHHCHLGGSSYHRTTENFSPDYIHPTSWSAWDNQNPHKHFIERLEILQGRRDPSEVYRTWGSEAAHRVIRQNLALFPKENDIQDETLLRILERECTAVLNENNIVFVDLHNRIIAYQLERQQKLRQAPITEEPFDAKPALQPEGGATATITTITTQNAAAQNAYCKAQNTLATTYRWSDFDSDDEELPDISDLLPAWVHPAPVLKTVEISPPKLVVEEVPVTEEKDAQFTCPIATPTHPLTAGEDSPNEGILGPQPSHEKAGPGLSRLPTISEELEDDEGDLSETGSDVTGDDDTSTSSSPPRTPVELDQYPDQEPLVATSPLQHPLSTSHTYNSRSGMLGVGDESETGKRHGKDFKLDVGNMSLDLERVEHWAARLGVTEPPLANCL